MLNASDCHPGGRAKNLRLVESVAYSSIKPHEKLSHHGNHDHFAWLAARAQTIAERPDLRIPSHRAASGIEQNRLHGGATRDETAPRVRAAALVNARCQAAERSDLLTFHASKLGQFRQQRACRSLRYSFALAHDGFLEDDLRIAAFVQREFHPDRDELGLQMSNHALDRGLRRSDRSGLASTLLGMERRLELTMARNQRIQHHIFSSPKAQFSGIETIAPKIAQQPCIDGIGLGLDTLNLAKCLHSRRMHDCPRNAGCAQRGFKVALVTTATLEHDEVATGIECGNQYRYIHGLIPVPPDARRTLARHIDPTLADIDTNHSLALHADLHHVSRVRTEHSIVCGCSPIYRSCSGPQKPAGLQISTVVETLRDLEVPPALPSVEGRDQHTTGTEIVHVPYKGGAQAINDLIAGHVDLMFESLNSISSTAKAGSVHPLGVSGPRRSPAFPDLPTIGETVPGYDAGTWSGVIAPAGLPKPILEKLNAAINRAVSVPAFKERFGAIGDEPAGGTPEEFAETIRKDSTKWEEVVRRSGAKLD